MADLVLIPGTSELLFRDGDLVLFDDDSPYDVASEVVQRVKQRLLTFLGEWFEDTRRGVDWQDSILIRPFNRPLAEGLIRATIAETPGVSDVLSFSMTVTSGATKTATVYCEIKAGAIAVPLEVTV